MLLGTVDIAFCFWYPPLNQVDGIAEALLEKKRTAMTKKDDTVSLPLSQGRPLEFDDDFIAKVSKSNRRTSALIRLFSHRWPPDLLDRVRNRRF